jgi:hypothetical protein
MLHHPLGEITAYELPLVWLTERETFASSVSGSPAFIHSAIPRSLPQLRGTVFYKRLPRNEAERRSKGAPHRTTQP